MNVHVAAAITGKIVIDHNFITKAHREIILSSIYKFSWSRNPMVSLD